MERMEKGLEAKDASLRKKHVEGSGTQIVVNYYSSMSPI